MNRLHCPKCENLFYTAARNPHLPCPYCGFELKSNDPDRRIWSRQPSQRFCDILKGEVKIPAKTVDVSDTGLGIKMLGYLPFDQDDMVSVFVKELAMDRTAQVVWTRKFYGISRAGLRFMDEADAVA